MNKVMTRRASLGVGITVRTLFLNLNINLVKMFENKFKVIVVRFLTRKRDFYLSLF